MEPHPEGGGRGMLTAILIPVQVAWSQLPMEPDMGVVVPWLGL